MKTPQSPAPVAGDEDTRPASEQPVEAIGAGRRELLERLEAEVSDETMRALLSCKDVGSGRAHLARILAALSPASPARTPMGGWPEVTDQWAETYCELTGRDPDGQQVTFVDGGTVTTFRDVAKREIEAMLCAAPKSAVRTIATAEPAEARIRELEQWQFNAIRSARLHDENARELDARATAAEAQLARAVEGLERIAGQSGDAGEKVWSDRAWLNFREVARQTLAALQQEGE